MKVRDASRIPKKRELKAPSAVIRFPLYHSDASRIPKKRELKAGNFFLDKLPMAWMHRESLRRGN